MTAAESTQIHTNPDGTKVVVPHKVAIGRGVTIGKWVTFVPEPDYPDPDDDELQPSIHLGDNVVIDSGCCLVGIMRIGHNTVIDSSTTIVGAGLEIGAHTIIGSSVCIHQAEGDTVIGDHVVIANYAAILDGARIGSYAVIGHNATIGKDVTIGNYVRIGQQVAVEGFLTIPEGILVGEDPVVNTSESVYVVPKRSSVIMF